MLNSVYSKVIEWIPEKSRVLDLGTGDGYFLDKLIRSRNVDGEGVEKDTEKVARCIERGLVVYQSDVLEGLDQYGSKAFDYVLLMGTFQELAEPVKTLNEAFRVGKRVIVGYNNFAYWKIRCQIMFSGKTPVTNSMPLPWYDSPNIQYFSVFDFNNFFQVVSVNEVHHAYFNARGEISICPNLFAEYALSMIEPKIGSSL